MGSKRHRQSKSDHKRDDDAHREREKLRYQAKNARVAET